MKKKIASIFLTSVVMMVSLGTCVLAAAPEKIDEKTKEAYYAEYMGIVKEVSEETGSDITLLPMREFAEDDWKTPEEFRDFITEIANWTIVCNETSAIQARALTRTKTDTITADGKNFTISITGTFETMYNSAMDRQIFKSCNSVTSSLSSGTGSWRQTGYESDGMDAARTYKITVSGTLTVAGAVFNNKLATAFFYCTATGNVN